MGLEDYDDPRRVEARRLFEAEQMRRQTGATSQREEEGEMAHEVTESDIDGAGARAFGRAPATSAELFRQAGFCEEDAAEGARLLESGKYFGFEDVATSMGMLDEAYEFRRRNPDVTAWRIAEVAKQSRLGTDVSESDKQQLSEADFDALDDAVFGRPGKAQR